MSTILLLLLFVLAWVVLILPKQRELRRHNALLATLVEGDEVMSGSGIYGTITAIDGDVVYLEVAPGLELKVARRAVASKVAPAVDGGRRRRGRRDGRRWTRPATVPRSTRSTTTPW